MGSEEYTKVNIKVRGQIITLYYIDYGMIEDQTCLRQRCIDWHIEEDFEFEEGEECEIHSWLANFIDGKNVPDELGDIAVQSCTEEDELS